MDRDPKYGNGGPSSAVRAAFVGAMLSVLVFGVWLASGAVTKVWDSATGQDPFAELRAAREAARQRMAKQDVKPAPPPPQQQPPPAPKVTPAPQKPAAPAMRDAQSAVTWLKLDPSTRLDRIAFGANLDQRERQPIWADVTREAPQLFLMVGGGVTSGGTEGNIVGLRAAYDVQARQAELSRAREKIPFLAIWGNYDYGVRNAGAEYANKRQSEWAFRQFWKPDIDSRPEGGVYFAQTYGPEGARIQVILLDTRSFRSPLGLKPPGPSGSGRFAPDSDPSKTMLGKAQWAWLEQELRKPADLRVIASPIPMLSDTMGFETWSKLPLERAKLLKMFERTKAKGIILVSGERRGDSFDEQALGDGRTVPEMTTAGLNRTSFMSQILTGQAIELDELISDTSGDGEYGVLDINWQAREVHLKVHKLGGEILKEVHVPFVELGLAQ